MQEKIQELANLISQQTEERFIRQGFTSVVHKSSFVVKIIPGKKYIKVDVGTSGKLMIDVDGNIYGIKGYGVINKKKCYGTLDTTDNFYWGEYYPKKKGI